MGYLKKEIWPALGPILAEVVKSGKPRHVRIEPNGTMHATLKTRAALYVLTGGLVRVDVGAEPTWICAVRLRKIFTALAARDSIVLHVLPDGRGVEVLVNGEITATLRDDRPAITPAVTDWSRLCGQVDVEVKHEIAAREFDSLAAVAGEGKYDAIAFTPSGRIVATNGRIAIERHKRPIEVDGVGPIVVPTYILRLLRGIPGTLTVGQTDDELIITATDCGNVTTTVLAPRPETTPDIADIAEIVGNLDRSPAGDVHRFTATTSEIRTWTRQMAALFGRRPVEPVYAEYDPDRMRLTATNADGEEYCRAVDVLLDDLGSMGPIRFSTALLADLAKAVDPTSVRITVADPDTPIVVESATPSNDVGFLMPTTKRT